MAQINLKKMKMIDKHRSVIHDKVFCTYTVFENLGEKYVQIDTYGRNEREMPEKASQSLQFDKETAKYFVDLMTKELSINNLLFQW